MKIRNSKKNIEISSPNLCKGAYNGKDVFLDEDFEELFYLRDGWEEVKELSEEEKLNQLWLVLSEWEPRDVVDMIIDEYKTKIGNENQE